MPSYGPPPPYRPDPRASQNMLDLIMNQGRIRADAAQQSSAIWGNAIAGAGQALAGGIQARAAEGERTRQSRAFEAAINSGDPRAIISVLGPRDGPAVITALRASTPDGMKGYQDRMALGRDLSRGVLATPEDMRPQAYAFARTQAINAGAFKADELPEAYAEALPILNQVSNYGREEAKPAGTREVKVRNADGSDTIQIVPDAPGQTFRSAPEPARPETRGVDVQAAEALARGDTETYNRLLRVKKEMGQADDRPITINQPRPISQTAEAGLIQKFTKEWDTAAAPVREIERQVGIMGAGLTAARRGDLGAGSQAIIQTFNKILDSLSVVREPEYLRTSEGQALQSRIRGAIERLTVGGAGVPIDELEKYAKLAREMAESQKSFLPAIRARVGRKADRYNIPQDLIFEAETAPAVVPPPASRSAAPPAAGDGPVRISNDAEWNALAPGTLFIGPDGQPRKK